MSALARSFTFFSLIALLPACADSDPDSGRIDSSDTSETGEHTPAPPVESTCGNGTVESHEECDGENLADETCVSLGYAGGTLRCNASCRFDLSGCVDDGQCAAPGQTCTETSQSSSAYVCDTETNECLVRCDPSRNVDTDNHPCPSGSWCFELGEIREEIPDGPPGFCFAGDCSNIFHPEQCGDEATCTPVGNEASFCARAGTIHEGETCGVEIGRCRPGLLCLNRACVRPCDLTGESPDARQCDENRECSPVFDTTASNRPGHCTPTCRPFEQQDCPTDSACIPRLRHDGEVAWFCDEPTERRLNTGQPCVPDDACEAGSVCFNRGTADFPNFRCSALCNAGRGLPDCRSEQQRATTCVPLTAEPLGICIPQCEPYPRRGTGQYDCPADTDTCNPIPRDHFTMPAEPDGYCATVHGNDAPQPGEPCSNEGSLHECADSAICHASREGETPTCKALCGPLSSGECGPDAFCSPVPMLVGYTHIGFCEHDNIVSDIDLGDACPEGTRGYLCGDHAICNPELGEHPLTCIGLCAQWSPCADGTCTPAVQQGYGMCI